MTKLNSPSPTIATETESALPEAAARSGHLQTIYNVVIAAYIHDISTRNRRGVLADAGNDGGRGMSRTAERLSPPARQTRRLHAPRLRDSQGLASVRSCECNR